jgi:hypothetical protein
LNLGGPTWNVVTIRSVSTPVLGAVHAKSFDLGPPPRDGEGARQVAHFRSCGSNAPADLTVETPEMCATSIHP